MWKHYKEILKIKQKIAYLMAFSLWLSIAFSWVYLSESKNNNLTWQYLVPLCNLIPSQKCHHNLVKWNPGEILENTYILKMIIQSVH